MDDNEQEAQLLTREISFQRIRNTIRMRGSSAERCYVRVRR